MSFVMAWIVAPLLARLAPLKAALMAGGVMLLIGAIGGFAFGLRLAAYERDAAAVDGYRKQIVVLQTRLAEHEREAQRQRADAQDAVVAASRTREYIAELEAKIDATPPPPIPVDCNLPAPRVRELNAAPAAARRTIAPAAARRPDGRSPGPAVPRGWKPSVTREGLSVYDRSGS